jgi:hypothetical protein
MRRLKLAKRKNKSENAKRRAKFRASPEWKEFRKWKMEDQGFIDPITGSKLPPRFHLHHKDLSVEDYEDLSNEDNYIGLQPSTHKVVHWCLVQIKKYHSMEVIDRLYRELETEASLNGFVE